LQREPTPEENAILQDQLQRPVFDASDYNNELEKMLALLALLNDYIGVSNTNMHLFAAVQQSIPAKVLIPYPAEWRWLESGDQSPWFPHFQLFRQAPDHQWSAALSHLRASLSY
jgi:hypothetical protein